VEIGEEEGVDNTGVVVVCWCQSGNPEKRYEGPVGESVAEDSSSRVGVSEGDPAAIVDRHTYH
jgi:hypothetical protein